MAQYLKWGAIIIGAFLIWSWLRNGIGANASFNANVNPPGWGNGFIWGPSNSAGAYPYGAEYGYPPASAYSSFAFGGATPVQVKGGGAPPWYAYLLNATIDVGYQNGGFDIGYGG